MRPVAIRTLAVLWCANTVLLLLQYLDYLHWLERAGGVLRGQHDLLLVDLLCLLVPPLALIGLRLLVSRRLARGVALLSLHAVASFAMVWWGDAQTGVQLAIPIMLLVGLVWFCWLQPARGLTVQVASQTALAPVADNEFDRADAMGDPARIHRQAA